MSTPCSAKTAADGLDGGRGRKEGTRQRHKVRQGHSFCPCVLRGTHDLDRESRALGRSFLHRQGAHAVGTRTAQRNKIINNNAAVNQIKKMNTATYHTRQEALEASKASTTQCARKGESIAGRADAGHKKKKIGICGTECGDTAATSDMSYPGPRNAQASARLGALTSRSSSGRPTSPSPPAAP